MVSIRQDYFGGKAILPDNPVLFDNLTIACNRKTQLRNVLRYSRSGSYVRIVVKSHRRNQIRIASDKNIVPDNTGGLIQTVVVACNGTASEIDILSYLRIADISQVARPGIIAD